MACERGSRSGSSSGTNSPTEGVTRMEIGGERIGPSLDAESIAATSVEHSNLRRSNSAPMFNGPNMTDDSPVFQPIPDKPRMRRFSTHITGSPKPPSTPIRIPSRVSQIKHEESMDIVSQENKGEREVQSAFQMSHSWDELHLSASITSLRSDSNRFSRFSDPLSIMPAAFPLSSSPSPTRTGKQCFSPSAHSMRGNWSPIPSPTRSTVTRRSMSPVLRPSPLGPVKRKGDSDMDTTPSKRLLLSSPSYPSSTTSISSLSSDDSSPRQRSISDGSSVSNSVPSVPHQFSFPSSTSTTHV